MIQISEKQKKKHTCLDILYASCTYIAGSFSILILIAIFVFIFSKGYSSLGFDLLTNNYWSKNYIGEVLNNDSTPTRFQKPQDLHKDAYFSKRWGIALIDTLDQNNDRVVLLEYIDDNSVFAHLKDKSVHDKHVEMKGECGYQLERLHYLDAQGEKHITGNLMSQSAKEIVDILDQQADAIDEIYFKTPGGGIRGSLITTAYLMLIALLLALPLGIGAAVYLHEYALKNRFTHILRSAIEMLSGVPSIIFGLMGVSVLFPITRLFGADTVNILLGGLTLAIIVLPIMIRSSEEALRVVPQTLTEASLSLGANQTQTLFKVVLPNALPGILSGVLLSIGRVIGESAALIYTMGTYVNDTPQILSQGTSLAVHIYNIMSSEQPNFELACAIAIIILIFVFILNVSIKLITHHISKFARQGG